MSAKSPDQTEDDSAVSSHDDVERHSEGGRNGFERSGGACCSPPDSWPPILNALLSGSNLPVFRKYASYQVVSRICIINLNTGNMFDL